MSETIIKTSSWGQKRLTGSDAVIYKHDLVVLLKDVYFIHVYHSRLILFLNLLSADTLQVPFGNPVSADHPPHVPHPPLPAFSTPPLLLSLGVGQPLQRCAQKPERSRSGVDGCQRAEEEQSGEKREEKKKPKNLSAGTSVKQVRQRGKRDRDEKTEPRGGGKEERFLYRHSEHEMKRRGERRRSERKQQGVSTERENSNES